MRLGATSWSDLASKNRAAAFLQDHGLDYAVEGAALNLFISEVPELGGLSPYEGSALGLSQPDLACLSQLVADERCRQGFKDFVAVMQVRV